MSIHWDGLWHLGLQRIQSRGSLRVRLAGQKRGANKASLKSPQFPRECLQKTTPSHASPKVCFGASRGNSEAQSERGWEERESVCESGGRKAGEWAGKGGRNGKLAETVVQPDSLRSRWSEGVLRAQRRMRQIGCGWWGEWWEVEKWSL
jgi:hypothetical protein